MSVADGASGFPEVGARYRHFKGGEYAIVALAHDATSRGSVVVYRALYATGDYPSGTVWTRPLEAFTDTVEKPGYTGPRFTRVR